MSDRLSEAPIVHGGGIAAAAARHGGAPEDWLDLSTGINPAPPPLPAIAPAAWHRLPDADLVDGARRAARAFYGADRCMPLPVPGTQSVIQILPRLCQGRRGAIFSPTYGEYGRVLRNSGIAVDEVAALEDVTQAHALAVVVNPNNPDGRRHPPAALLALHERMRAWGGLLVVDEAFGDMQPDLSLAGAAGARPGLFVFRSFGKFFGYAGLRLGFVLGEDAALAAIADRLGPWAVSGPALGVAQALMASGRAAIADTIRRRKAALDAVLASSGMTILGGADLFTLVRVADAASLHEDLCRHLILVRRFDYEPHWLRIGLAPDEAADRRLAAALAAVLPR